MPPRPVTERPLDELRQKYLAAGLSPPTGLVASLLADPREGAQKLGAALKKKQAENRAEGQRLRHMLKFETELWAEGHAFIAGVDEAGMGPCAGPVCAAAAILPQGYKLRGLDDSKKILDEDTRAELAESIKKDAICWAVGWAEVREIDSINIYHAGLLAMRRAVEGLSQAPSYVLVDARKIPGIAQPQRGIIKGDAQSLSIAAGAMIAKTTRDRFMIELDVKFPGYNFSQHKGYATAEHMAAIDRLGVIDHHRRSFAPVRKALGLVPVQEELFP